VAGSKEASKTKLASDDKLNTSDTIYIDQDGNLRSIEK
jgi:hypothetical protein